MISNLARVVDRRRWKYLELRNTRAHFGAGDKFAVSKSYVLHRLDLTPNDNELFAKLHKDCIQRKIRRAQRESLRYEAGRSDALLKDFYRLLVMTRRRHGLPPQPFKWFRNLAVSFGGRLKIHIVSKSGVSIAGILTLSHKKTVTYKYACSDARYHSSGGPAFGLWMVVIQAKSEGFEELDMGRSSVDDAGLVAFKEHWGARQSVLEYVRYPAASAAKYQWTRRLMTRVAAFAPSSALTAAGNLLYRHIG